MKERLYMAVAQLIADRLIKDLRILDEPDLMGPKDTPCAVRDGQTSIYA